MTSSHGTNSAAARVSLKWNEFHQRSLNKVLQEERGNHPECGKLQTWCHLCWVGVWVAEGSDSGSGAGRHCQVWGSGEGGQLGVTGLNVWEDRKF